MQLTNARVVACRGIYSATKGAVLRLSDALRLECRPLGIQVVLVAPGFIDTKARNTAKVRALQVWGWLVCGGADMLAVGVLPHLQLCGHAHMG
jgi:short-subunit dehydrogenase